MGRIVYMNGNFVPEEEAKISIYDSALMFGDMVFEMTRSFNKKQFKLKDHIDRLFNSIKFVQIPLKMTPKEMEVACLETIEKNEPFFQSHDEHRLMINVSRGPLSIYADIFGGKLDANVIISDFPLKWTVAGMGELFDNGINSVITSQRAIPAYLLEPKVKNRSRIHFMMANIEASHWPGNNNWALLLDPDGFIAEGTGDNFFMVKDNVLYTPEPRNILRGISRDYVFELANQLGLQWREKNIEVYDVMTADEAFMTGTPFCMLPVTKINGIQVGNGTRGNIFNTILKRWSQNVNLNIEDQIKKYSNELKNRSLNSPSPYNFTTKKED